MFDIIIALIIVLSFNNSGFTAQARIPPSAISYSWYERRWQHSTSTYNVPLASHRYFTASMTLHRTHLRIETKRIINNGIQLLLYYCCVAAV